MIRRAFLAVGASVVIVAGSRVLRFSEGTSSFAKLLVNPEATATPTPVGDNEPSPSGGLGNSRSDLDTAYGRPSGLQGTMLSYSGGRRAVSFVNDQAEGILLTFPASEATSLSEARHRVAALLPRDAVLDGTVGAGPRRVADLYHSAKLATIAIPPTPTTRPGQFVTVFESDPTGAIRTALIALGRVPPG